MLLPKKIFQFLKSDLWRIRLKDLTPKKSFWLKQLRILTLSFQEFYKDKCILRASALTFYTLLSIVPLLALGFGIAKSFGLEKELAQHIYKAFQEHKEVADKIINFSNKLLENTKEGIIAGVGIIILFWTVIKVLGNIEASFNDIWGVKRPRSWGRKFSDYLAFMMVAPIIFIAASSMTVAITAQVTAIIEQLKLWGWFGSLVFLLLKLLPFSLIWGLFTFTYIFIPNTKVHFSSGLLGGILAGTIYQIFQLIYVNFQIGVAKYNAIYGSFAALPLFLIWLQISWLVVLYGAEIAFAHQNVDTYEFEPDCLKISPFFKKIITLGVVHNCIKKFKNGETPPTAIEIAHQMDVPIRLINQIIFELVEAQILSEVRKDKDNLYAYQPAKNIDEITVQNVLSGLDQYGIDNIPILSSPEMEKLKESLESFWKLIENSDKNIKLKDL